MTVSSPFGCFGIFGTTSLPHIHPPCPGSSPDNPHVSPAGQETIRFDRTDEWVGLRRSEMQGNPVHAPAPAAYSDRRDITLHAAAVNALSLDSLAARR